MPLTERSINTQRDLPRNKRHSIQSDLAYTRLKDENSPSLGGTGSKTTPISQRLLAPTKASAAKATTPPSRAAGLTSRQPFTSSKLPRRTTPSTAPQTSDYRTLVIDQTSPTPAPTGNASGYRKPLSETVTIHNHLPVRRASSIQKASLIMSTKVKSQPSSRAVSAADKPLPPRPAASLVSSLSPTKDSRTLLDASERPLKVSVDGSLRDWSPIKPESATDLTERMTSLQHESKIIPATQTSAHDYAFPLKDPASSSEANDSMPSIDQAVTEYAASERSSSSTFMSANDGMLQNLADINSSPTNEMAIEGAAMTDNLTTHGSTDNHRHQVSAQGYPPRDASLQAQHNLVSANAPELDQVCPLTGFTDLIQATPRPTADSRPHSPSPASFSRPRPSSISHGRTLTLPNTTATNAAKVLRAQKTASRIPIPDTKKATLVDVKTRTSASTQKSEYAPSFGSRRLDAPDTLKILDQGIKRRQMNQPKRADREYGTATPDSSSTHTYGHNDFSHVDRSRCSTPDGTFGASSSDDEEVVTPTTQPGGTELRDKPLAHPTNSYYHNTAVKLFDGAVSALARTPPPTSPYTDPLQTIPSQVVLPDYDYKDTPSTPTTSTKPSDLAEFNKRLSDLYMAHADHTASRIGDRARAPESTKYSLLELLNEYTCDDGPDSQGGLDSETRKHLTSTLSVLEGKGSPLNTDVDNETLLRLFGHLKRGLERQPDSVSFVNNAAAAEKFLGQDSNAGVLISPDGEGPHEERHESGTVVAEAKPILPPIQTVASKWSDSTGSVQAVSPDPSEVSPRQLRSARKTAKLNEPQRPAPDPPCSIGYPSRVPSKAGRLIGPGSSGAATPPEPVRRLSSPTLGKRTPGSVRAARETLHQIKGGFARTTASAESRKSNKMPTANTKALKLPENGQRGRVSSADKSRSQSEGAALHVVSWTRKLAATTSANSKQTPRARSRSRYVFDKINGLFSTKHSKRSTMMPPVPAIAELDGTPNRTGEVTTNGSPVVRSMKGPLGAKMPTLSPATEHPALRSMSRSDTSTMAKSPTDSVTAGDDSTALQSWAATLVSKAVRERDPVRKQRLVDFAKVLNDSMISAREAQISAETAQHAAKSAQMSYELTQKSVAMLQRLATSLTTRGVRRSIGA